MSFFKTAKGTELPFLDLRGKQYLQVMHRLVWFREEKPNWSIQTSIVNFNEKFCVCSAEILDETGRLIAIAHGREDVAHFADNLEKAETKAIGRALAFVGYGTAFAQELEENERLADSPAPRAKAVEKPRQVQPADIGDTVVTFGKFKGKTFKQVGAGPLNEYALYIDSCLKKENKKPHQETANFLRDVAEYLKNENPKI